MSMKHELITTIIFICFVRTISVILSGGQTYHGERHDLLALRDSLSTPTNLLRSNWTGPPCKKDESRWFGIACSVSGAVVGISLEGIHLTGPLPPAALQNVTYLSNLSLGGNALSGGLPALRGLRRLRVVSLSRNRFSGPVPADYLALPVLSRLELQDNLLDGTIPPFEQDSLAAFNVSYNFLRGPIPQTSVMQRFPNSSYDHNLGLCGKPLVDEPYCAAPPSPPPPPPPPCSPRPSWSGAKGVRWWSVGLVAVAAVMVSAMIFFCSSSLYKKYRKSADYVGEVLPSEDTRTKARASVGRREKEEFELEFVDKERASFDLNSLLGSSAEVIGKGRLGTAYKTTLESGAEVVVKRLRDMGPGPSRKEFLQQMRLLGGMKHDNLVEIVAFYYSKDDKFVVYENVAGGNLFQLLHENRGEGRVPISWQPRLNIAKGIVRGLAYLHNSLPSHKVPHGNLKSSNVLLLRRDNHHYHPKLTDFGFLQLLPHPHQAQKLAVRKTPEFSQGRKLTHKSDVYCLGLVLLEIVTGQVPKEEESLPSWVRSVVGDDLSTDVFDIEIVADKGSHNDMLKLVEIALDCTAFDPRNRPKMTELVERIEGIKQEQRDR